MTRPRTFLAISLAAAISLLVPAAGVLAVNGGACKAPYHVVIDPANFTDAHGKPNPIDNPYFPLMPGTTWTYDGVKEGAPLHDVMRVTRRTRTIMGVTVRVVRDTDWEDGLLAEDTFDWYAQDDEGNVWYFGEDTTEFDAQGNVATTEGSWEAGDGRNLPGILMLAAPRSGRTYRQEYGPGVAVDLATVLSLHRHRTEPTGSYPQVIETKEYSCLEQGVDHKFYARGIGLISEVDFGDEYIDLTGLTP